MYTHLNETKITMQHWLKKIMFFLVLGLSCHLGLFSSKSIRWIWSRKWPFCYLFIFTLTQILKLHIITCIYYDLPTIYIALIEMLTHHRRLLCWRQVVSDFHLLYRIKIDKRVLNTSATLLSVIAVGMLFHHYRDIPQCRR